MDKLQHTYFTKISVTQLKSDELNDLLPVLEKLELPQRATTGSCGYDFHIPYDLHLEPGETAKIPSLVRVAIDEGWFLLIVPRSSLGFKYKCQLDNTAGIIDSDYFNAKNEGHIWIKMTNNGTKPLDLKYGEAFCQGIFVPFGITVDDDATGQRIGGFGSTNK